MYQQYQYSQTCFFTRTPILPGSECCVFTVVSTSICELNCGRPESWYAPVPVPLLYGTYDGFGSVNLTDPKQIWEMQNWYKKQQKPVNGLPDIDFFKKLMYGGLGITDEHGQYDALFPVFISRHVWETLVRAAEAYTRKEAEELLRLLRRFSDREDPILQEEIMRIICRGNVLYGYYAVQPETSEETALSMFYLYRLADFLQQPFLPYGRDPEMGNMENKGCSKHLRRLKEHLALEI